MIIEEDHLCFNPKLSIISLGYMIGLMSGSFFLWAIISVVMTGTLYITYKK